MAHCLVATTTSGEFKLGNKTVPINKPIVMQGGIIEGSHVLVPAADGNTLSHTPLTVPGGLTGIEGLPLAGSDAAPNSRGRWKCSRKTSPTDVGRP